MESVFSVLIISGVLEVFILSQDTCHMAPVFPSGDSGMRVMNPSLRLVVSGHLCLAIPPTF